jgi:hypothetical protein
MVDSVKFGAVVTLAGFLMIGFPMLYVNMAPSPTTPEGILASLAVARNLGIVQGVGWIVVGWGFYIVFLGSAKSDTAIDTKSEILLGRLPKHRSKFVCSECGGDLSGDAVTCPHCGAPIND